MILIFAIGITAQSTINVTQHNGERITLPYEQNDLTLEYIGIHFDNPEKITYQYKMEGVHEDWQLVGTERTARFNNLAAGEYTFFVKAANADGVWNETPATLSVIILSPWWWTTWMKLIYLLTIGTGLFVFYRFQLEKKLATAEAIRLQELDIVKTKMYTNITHEFRTPLSVIQGTAEQLEGNEKAKETIHRNSIDLLNLVNQMLDLSKLEAGSLPLNLIQGDVINYLSYLIESYQSFAASKSIGLHFLPSVTTLQMDYDPDKLMKIVVNLLSNAIKFTEEGGNVYIQVGIENQKGSLPLLGSSKMLSIAVKDTGIGIPKEALPHIFDRFYQVDDSSTRKEEGTGIGLAFIKELVKLMHGSVTVESKAGKGSIFTLVVPITNTAKQGTQNAIPVLLKNFQQENKRQEQLAENLVPSKTLSTVLVVEDNKDVRNYLYSCLEKEYQLLFASNGKRGIDLAIEQMPDLIISDVMMPEADGFELCQTLKEDERSGHIPIILLTAKVDTDSRITGLRKGADAYISKPFNQEELLAKLDQLLVQRTRLHRYYKEQLTTTETTTTITSQKMEDPILVRLTTLVEEELDKVWTIENLCLDLGMSRSQVYRKVKAVTGYSTTIYIRHIKLKHALVLLKTTDKTIAEIAYSVGFRDPAFFTRCFSEVFGKTPKEVRRK